ncbi:hypothetical protein ACGFNU_33520 [Spirillospora sp. NPDC048911]|uniref:hypothetical protein n=1 Tax=Spirillospora sp. NPDC048911 TaxID=3364527 RepID=UPI0037220E2B
MKHVVAAAVTLLGGVALAYAAYGEGAFNILYLVGVPGALIALFVLPLRSEPRPGGLRWIGWSVTAVLTAGLAIVAATAPEFALLLALIGTLYLLIGWPLAISGACVMAVAAVRSGLAPGPAAARRMWARLSWTLLLCVVAAYGYGFSHLDDAMADVKDRVCRSDASGGQVKPGGGQSLLPLSDTSCGADTVPGFVNPLLALLAGLLVVCVAGHLTARLRTRPTM